MEPLIPIYLIVSGVFGIVLIPFIMVCSCLKCQSIKDCYICVNGIVIFLLSLFYFAWFLCGNVLVFSKYKPEYKPMTHPLKYCDETTYKLPFWIIISTYICSIMACCGCYCFRVKVTV